MSELPSDDLVLGHPFWGECDCDDEHEHQRRVAELAPYTKEIERLRRFETVAQKALAKATTWHEMLEGRTRARDQGGKLIPVRDLIKAEAFVSEVAAHYATLEKERADEAADEIERLREIVWKFGAHMPFCTWRQDESQCSCGFRAILGGTPRGP